MSSKDTPVKVTDGEVDFSVPAAGKPCKTWYQVHGDLSGGVPLIVVHGGPGLSHDALLCLTDLTTKYNIPTLFYDQLGNARSTHLPEKKGDEAFWTEELLIFELENLVAKLGLETYDVLGHSWGGMMASNFAARQTKGLRKLIISNAPATMELWLENSGRYLRGLPQDVQDILKKHEDAGTTDDPEYEEAMGIYFKKHVFWADPMPENILRSMEWAEKDDTVTMTMTGPSEWECVGTLRNWSAAENTHKINVPTLVINGVNEIAEDNAIAPFLENIPDVKWVKFAQSTHMPLYEERDKYMHVVSEFLSI